MIFTFRAVSFFFVRILCDAHARTMATQIFHLELSRILIFFFFFFSSTYVLRRVNRLHIIVATRSGEVGGAGAGQVTGGPAGLEVEAAGDGVDVEEFAGEVEAGESFGPHGAGVHFGQGDAAGRDELVLVGVAALEGKAALREGVAQGGELLGVDPGPRGLAVDDVGHEELPESFGHGVREGPFLRRRHDLRRVVSFVRGQLFECVLRTQVGKGV
mmetsp:Transcript_17199/g.52257  ORF Transcript_17199/g.52257 Transcript_17199/m.52257 type:complete len:215 (+) Transcript_17199:1224-1868(+)